MQNNQKIYNSQIVQNYQSHHMPLLNVNVLSPTSETAGQSQKGAIAHLQNDISDCSNNEETILIDSSGSSSNSSVTTVANILSFPSAIPSPIGFHQNTFSNANISPPRFVATPVTNSRPFVITQQILSPQKTSTSSYELLSNTLNSKQLIRLQTVNRKNYANLASHELNILGRHCGPIPQQSALSMNSQTLPKLRAGSTNAVLENYSSPIAGKVSDCDPCSSTSIKRAYSAVIPIGNVQPVKGQSYEKPQTDEYYRRKQLLLKKSVKSLVFKNASLCDEVSRLSQRILAVSEERRILLKKLLVFEKVKEKRRCSTTLSKKCVKPPIILQIPIPSIDQMDDKFNINILNNVEDKKFLRIQNSELECKTDDMILLSDVNDHNA